MRPSVRLLNLEVSSLQSSRSLYVCSTCRQGSRQPLARQFVRNASSSSLPLTERLRRKIWGTENPPGMKDPYGGQGVLEKRFKKNQGQDQQQAVQEAGPVEEAQDIAPGETYVEATTWEGLERIGHLGRWSDLPPSEADTFSPFHKHKINKEGWISLAAHQAAVEVALLHDLKKPTTNLYNVIDHDRDVFNLMLRCKFQDGAIVFPNKETKKALYYIFKQIGGQPKAAVAEEAVSQTEAAEQTEEGVEELSYEEAVNNKPHSSPFFGRQDVKNNTYLGMPLKDANIKFAFLKRFTQLTGHYIPDNVVNSASTINDVMKHIHQKIHPKPEKLGDYLASNRDLQALPNVKIFTKRQVRSHRDEEVGRKKIIEAELRARDLL